MTSIQKEKKPEPVRMNREQRRKFKLKYKILPAALGILNAGEPFINEEKREIKLQRKKGFKS